MGDEKLLKEIGQRINLRRKELKLTQEQLAEKMDVSVQMISNLELGKKAVRPENIVKLCNILSVSADYILMGRRSAYEMQNITEDFMRLPSDKQQLVEEVIRAMI